MDIQKEAAKIYETRDYEMFTFYAGNRNINEAKVKDLIRSFNERYYPVPIIVDSHNQILDGQHRLEAASSGGFPVFFLTLPDDIVPTQVIRQLNADQKSYNLPDYMKLSNCKGFISVDSCLNHFARSAGRKGVVIWGGTRWIQLGYKQNKNINKWHNGLYIAHLKR